MSNYTADNFTTSVPTTTKSDYDRVSEVIDLVKVWVPIVLTLIIVLFVCFVTIRSKAKRRRERQAGTSDPMRTVSGGVPTNVNAYRNYGIYVQRQQQQGSSTPCGITPQEALRNISYPEPPPSYEDTMKQSPGIINASFSSSQENLPPLERQTSNPPPYQPQYIAPEQSGSGQSSGDGTSQKLTGNSSAAENPEAPSIETPASSDQVNVSL